MTVEERDQFLYEELLGFKTFKRHGIDILLRLKAEESHGTAPLGWEFQVCSSTDPRHGENPCGVHGLKRVGLLGVPSPRYSYPLSCSDSRSCFCLRESDRLRRTRSYFLCECSPGACCLIPALGHTLFPVWADTRTASFRALGYTGAVTSAPTRTDTPFWNKNVRELPL